MGTFILKYLRQQALKMRQGLGNVVFQNILSVRLTNIVSLRGYRSERKRNVLSVDFFLPSQLLCPQADTPRPLPPQLLCTLGEGSQCIGCVCPQKHSTTKGQLILIQT
jgi:hypothetical protein